MIPLQSWIKNIFPTHWGQPTSLYTTSCNNGLYSNFYFAINSLEHRYGKRYICKQNPYWKKFSFTIFITFTSPKPSQVKYNIYVAALYVNIAVSFKSNIMLLLASYFDPIIRKENLYFGSPQIISVWHSCHARKIHSFPCEGQFNKSGNFSMS